MSKTFKYLLAGIGAFIILLLAAIGVIVATFDPADYKPVLTRMVQEKTQRTLTIPGDIRLSFFPRFGFDLGQASLSERNSSAQFAAVDHAQVSLALLPLLSKQVVIDRIKIDGLRANIRVDRAGNSNFEDLMPKERAAAAEPGGGEPATLDIDSVEIRNASISFDDRQQGRHFDVANLRIDTGKIAPGAASELTLAADVKGNLPEVNAHVTARTGFTLDPERDRVILKALNAELRGALAGVQDLLLTISGDADIASAARRFHLAGVKLHAAGKRAGETFDARIDMPKLVMTDTQVSSGRIVGEAKLAGGARNVTANFNVPSLDGTPQAFRLPALHIDAAIREDRLDAKIRLAGALTGNIDKLLFSSPQLSLTLSGKQGGKALSGTVSTPLTLDLKAQTFDMPKLAAELSLPHPGGDLLALRAGGKANGDLRKEYVSGNLNGTLDQSAFSARLGITDFTPMTYAFDIGADKLDLDRYKSKEVKGAAAPAQPPAAGAASAPQVEFAALQKLHASGSVRVGALKVANINASNVRFDLRSANGRLDISPVSANLYGGTAQGALGITAGKPARIALQQNLSGIQVGPLLRDAIGKEPMEGRGNVQLDIATSGATFDQIKKGLNGNARLELRDGAIRGVNIPQAVRSARARIDALRGKESSAASQSGTGSASEKTDFSELTGTFRIASGVARNDDLLVKSPLIRIAGAGEIDLGAERLDYLARTTVVSTLQGQGGPELQALKGITVPVRLSGPFSAIAWRIDVAGMASELAKQKLEERKGELKEKVEKALGGEKEKLREQLKEQLKGLLGR
ncbi:MAG TPA: AsmA family protein [Noviherbaspirillum sp.]